MSFEHGVKNPTKLNKRPKSRRILIIDDDPASLEIIMEPLRWEGYDIRGVTSGAEALEILTTWTPHIVILDWLEPTMSGIKILESIREKIVQISCIFVSANSNTDAIIKGLDSGADDYIVKPFVPLEFLARVRTHLRMRDLNEQLMFANERLKELVDIDDLTGLFNMRSFYQKLEFEMERAKRYNREVAVVMMDMDYFKTVNDGHDHLFGSYVLSEVGKIIKANTRNIDIPARYGGDEFLIVLSETNHEGVMYFCDRLRQNIEKTTFVNGSDSIKLTSSIGFSVLEPGEYVNPRELVRRADHALYDSKRAGRNRVSFYNPDHVGAEVIEIKKITEAKHKKASGE
jgi:two-component system cell cycle response regulator